MADITRAQVKDFLDKMTVIELAEFTKELEKSWGVTAAAPMAVAVAGPAAAAPVVEEQTEFNVILAGAGAQKIQVIKVVRELTGLGLKEAKELVDGAPKPVKEGVSKDEAKSIKEKLEAQGATIEIK